MKAISYIMMLSSLICAIVGIDEEQSYVKLQPKLDDTHMDAINTGIVVIYYAFILLILP
jgi:hypothetical protein